MDGLEEGVFVAYGILELVEPTTLVETYSSDRAVSIGVSPRSSKPNVSMSMCILD